MTGSHEWFLHGTAARLCPGDLLVPGQHAPLRAHRHSADGLHLMSSAAYDPLEDAAARARDPLLDLPGVSPRRPTKEWSLWQSAHEWAAYAADAYGDCTLTGRHHRGDHYRRALLRTPRLLRCLHIYLVQPTAPHAMTPDIPGSLYVGSGCVITGQPAVVVREVRSVGTLRRYVALLRTEPARLPETGPSLLAAASWPQPPGRSRSPPVAARRICHNTTRRLR